MLKQDHGFCATHILYAVALFFLLAPAGFSYASATSVSDDASLSDSLTAYWPLDESSGTRVDVKGTNDLTDNDTVTSASGIQEVAADFERDNSEFLSSASNVGLTATSDWSISFWVKHESVPAYGEMQQYFTKNIDDTNDIWYAGDVYESGGNVWLQNYLDGKRILETTYNWNQSTATWYNVVYTYDYDGTATMYINGSAVASSSTSANTNTWSGATLFQLGKATDPNGTVYSRYFDGLMDEVGVWSKVLSTTDIANLYNNGDGIPYDASSTEPETTAPGATARKNANESVTSSSAFQNDNDLALALASSAEYTIDAFIVATTTSKKPDLKLAFTTPDGSDMLVGYLAYTGMALAGGGILESSGTASDKILLSPTESTLIHVVGTIKTGSTDGSLTLQWAQNASDSASVTVRRGTICRY